MRKSIVLKGAVIGIVMAVVFCIPTSQVLAKEIKIAQIHPMTGPLAVIGQSAKRVLIQQRPGFGSLRQHRHQVVQITEKPYQLIRRKNLPEILSRFSAAAVSGNLHAELQQHAGDVPAD